MKPVHAFTTDQRRARLGIRHHLALRAATIERVAGDMVGLHASDPATVHLSARARVDGFAVADMEDALYERRTLVRMLGMRTTLFVVPRDLAAEMDAACTRAFAPVQRRRLAGMLADQRIAPDGDAWIAEVGSRVLRALEARGPSSAVELTKDVPELSAKLVFGEGKTWGGEVGVSTRLLFLLAAEGSIVRARPRGAWTSGAYRWALTQNWLGGPLPSIAHPDACAGLVRRYLRAFGPVTMTDVRWWTGWTAKLTTASLAAVGAVEVALPDTGGTGWILPEDAVAAPKAPRWAALLPGLDPTVMGWKERDWYLGPHAHAHALFDRNGNAGPTVWADGRIVGGWGQRADGEVVIAILEDLDRATTVRIEKERAHLQAWLGDVRLKPRFRSPLERTLSG